MEQTDGFPLKIINAEQWLNGSFCTNKLNPSDLDLLTIIDKEALDNLPPNVQKELEPLFLGKTTKDFCCCDSYIILNPVSNFRFFIRHC